MAAVSLDTPQVPRSLHRSLQGGIAKTNEWKLKVFMLIAVFLAIPLHKHSFLLPFLLGSTSIFRLTIEKMVCKIEAHEIQLHAWVRRCSSRGFIDGIQHATASEGDGWHHAASRLDKHLKYGRMPVFEKLQ